MRPHIGGIIEVIEQYADAPSAVPGFGDTALVIGVLGPAGSGKTFWLEAMRRHFAERLSRAATVLCQPQSPEQPPAKPTYPRALTLPVAFNAWRHQSAPDLLDVLLRTADRELTRHAEQEFDSRASGLSRVLDRRARKAALAVGRRLRTLGTELNNTGRALTAGHPGRRADEADRVIGEDDARRRAQAELDEWLYFEVHEHLRSLVTPATPRAPELTAQIPVGELPLNVVFLIDDLDRCEPGKVKQLLDAIHLLLDVPGFVFVIAVDDERLERQRLGMAPDSPGGIREYLQKVIPVPMRVPPLEQTQVRDFLLRNYRAVFVRGTPAAGFEPPIDGSLLDFFTRATPPAPRHLIQTLEVFRAVDAVARRETSSDHDRRLLGQLVLLGLFAPELYRLDRDVHRVLLLLAEWREHPTMSLSEVSTTVLSRYSPTGQDARWIDAWEQVREPLVAAVQRMVNSPGIFDPRRLILPDQQPSDFVPEIVRAHVCLADGEEVRHSTTLTAAMPGSEASEIPDTEGAEQKAEKAASASDRGEPEGKPEDSGAATKAEED